MSRPDDATAPQARRSTAARVVCELAAEHEVRSAFGIVSVHNLPLVDALVADGRYTAVRHEATAVNAADGYSRVAETLGLAVTSTGTGAGNAAGSLVEALTAGSRVLHVTGNVESAHLGAGLGVIHETKAQDRMLDAVTKVHHTVTTPGEIEALLRDASDRALAAADRPGKRRDPHRSPVRRSARRCRRHDRPGLDAPASTAPDEDGEPGHRRRPRTSRRRPRPGRAPARVGRRRGDRRPRAGGRALSALRHPGAHQQRRSGRAPRGRPLGRRELRRPRGRSGSSSTRPTSSCRSAPTSDPTRPATTSSGSRPTTSRSTSTRLRSGGPIPARSASSARPRPWSPPSPSG